jgi:hypothetical protein
MKHIPTYKEFLNEGVPTEDMHIYEVICRDQEGELKKIIECIGACGNTGHGFSVIVDPDEPEGLAERKFYWDGDGSDYLHSVKTIQTPVKESQEINEANRDIVNRQLNLLEVYAKDVLRNPKGNIEHFAQYIIDGIKEIRQNL